MPEPTDLGKRLNIYTARKMPIIFMILIGFAALLFIFFGFGMTSSARGAISLIYIVIVGVGFGLVGYIVYNMLQSRDRHLVLFEHGVYHKHGKNETTARWDKLQSLHVLARDTTPGDAKITISGYRLEFEDQPPITFPRPNGEWQPSELARQLTEYALSPVSTKLFKAWNNGEIISFGKRVSLSQQGIHYGRLIPWSTIIGFGVDNSDMGNPTIQVSSQRRPYIIFKTFPNDFVFSTVALFALHLYKGKQESHEKNESPTPNMLS